MYCLVRNTISFISLSPLCFFFPLDLHIEWDYYIDTLPLYSIIILAFNKPVKYIFTFHSEIKRLEAVSEYLFD